MSPRVGYMIINDLRSVKQWFLSADGSIIFILLPTIGWWLKMTGGEGGLPA